MNIQKLRETLEYAINRSIDPRAKDRAFWLLRARNLQAEIDSRLDFEVENLAKRY